MRVHTRRQCHVLTGRRAQPKHLRPPHDATTSHRCSSSGAPLIQTNPTEAAKYDGDHNTFANRHRYGNSARSTRAVRPLNAGTTCWRTAWTYPDEQVHVIGHDLLGRDLPAVFGGDLLQQLPAADRYTPAQNADTSGTTAGATPASTPLPQPAIRISQRT